MNRRMNMHAGFGGLGRDIKLDIRWLTAEAVF